MLRIYPVQDENLFYFTAGPTINANNDWIAWDKPDGIKWLHFTIIGGGGGGGRPSPGQSVTGAAGGTSGALTIIMVPASFLPDLIYIKPGAGGAGATTDTSPGLNGGTSYVCIRPSTANSAVVGLAGGGGGSVFGSNAPTAMVPAQNPFYNMFPCMAMPGSTNQGVQSIFPISAGGTGGSTSGGTGQSGLQVTGVGPMPTILGGPTSGTPGGHGVVLWRPFMSTGGGGGAGGSTGVTGGRGGDGAYGSGGGGGGASYLGNTGNGGNGGSGLVIVKCW